MSAYAYPVPLKIGIINSGTTLTVPNGRYSRWLPEEEACARAWGCSVSDLHGRSKMRGIVDARVALMFIFRERGWSLRQIGDYLGGRHHGTVAWNVASAGRYQSDPEFSRKLEAAREALGI